MPLAPGAVVEARLGTRWTANGEAAVAGIVGGLSVSTAPEAGEVSCVAAGHAAYRDQSVAVLRCEDRPGARPEA